MVSYPHMLVVKSRTKVNSSWHLEVGKDKGQRTKDKMTEE